MKPSKISELLEKVNHIAAEGDFSKLNKIEIDLLMQHLRDLYAELDSARNGNVQIQITDISNLQTEPLTNKRILNPNERVLINEPVTKKQAVTESLNSTKIEAEKEVATKTVVNAEVKQKETVSKSSINESTRTAASLNEKLKTEAKEVHKKLSTKPLKDLIDLNKKFILLNELFKGNSEAFSAAIHHIDSVADYDAAETFVNTELSTNYFWDESSQSVRMFKKLVKQKFGVE